MLRPYDHPLSPYARKDQAFEAVLRGGLRAGGAQGLFKREYRDHRNDRDHRLEWMIRPRGLQLVLAGPDKDNIRVSRDFR